MDNKWEAISCGLGELEERVVEKIDLPQLTKNVIDRARILAKYRKSHVLFKDEFLTKTGKLEDELLTIYPKKL